MKNNIETIRHTLAHVMAYAVKQLYPDVKFGIGPVIENGFYYDFDLPQKLSEKDFTEIEKIMREIISKEIGVEHRYVPVDEAIEEARSSGQNYKVELLEDIKSGKRIAITDEDIEQQKSGKISFYTIGEFTDLCRGPHVENTGDLPKDGFRLTTVAGAYWRGDEKNPQMQRIYAVAFLTKKELADHLAILEEAKKRDHRKIGKDLGLFVFSDLVGKGLPIFGPKGATIKRELERFIIDEELKRGYHHVVTPDLAKVDLYKKSGHYPYYKDTMYPVMKIDEEELILKPMTCPHHFMFYKSEQHSYRDLPYRIGEIAHQYRYEKSGELSGLTRVRMFCLADAHIISARNQAKQVIKEVLELIDFINKTLGLIKGVDYRYRLSLGDRSDTKKYYKDDTSWDYAENILREVLIEVKAPFYEAANEAAFYGPKIDIQVKNVSGSEETAFTVQYDFVMPERFDLSFINKEGKEERPIVIHRSSIGCLERTIAFLIEHYAGAFPTWLAPVQAIILPITEKQNQWGSDIFKELRDLGIRTEINLDNETLGKKIRQAELQKIPYLLIIGEKEEKAGSVAIRQRGKGDIGQMPLEEFVEKIKKEIQDKK